MATKLNLKVEFVGTDFSALLAQVKNKKFDLGSSSITITDARKKTVAFTNGYDFGYFGLDVPAGSDIKSFDQLKGKRVTVVQGTVQDDYATKLGLNPVRTRKVTSSTGAAEATTTARSTSSRPAPPRPGSPRLRSVRRPPRRAEARSSWQPSRSARRPRHSPSPTATRCS